VNLTETKNEATAYLLADHLDAMLAAGEDLLKVHDVVVSKISEPERRSIRGQIEGQLRCIDAIRTLELTLAMRGLQARERTEELRRADPRLDAIAGLFIGGTAPLADAARELGDWTEFDFQTGNEVAEYLRSRGLIPADSAGLVSLDELVVTARFLVARRIELGPLLDLTATFLDALELFYELYGGEDADEAGEAAADAMTDDAGPLPRPVV